MKKELEKKEENLVKSENNKDNVVNKKNNYNRKIKEKVNNDKNKDNSKNIDIDENKKTKKNDKLIEKKINNDKDKTKNKKLTEINVNNKLKNTKKKKRKFSRKRTVLVIISILLLIFLVCCWGYLISNELEEKRQTEIIRKEQELIAEINSHYGEYVITNKEANIYNEDGIEVGIISKNIKLSLDNIDIDKNTKYFKLLDFEDCFIRYEDVDVTSELDIFDMRYKSYVSFNENVITNDIVSFYDDDNNLIYKFNKSFELPIIIKDDNKYGVEFNNRLLYIKQDDVLNVIDSTNTDISKANSIRVIAYHAFYDRNDPTEAWCRNSICHSTEQIESHSKYISENNYFTLTMNELEMYIDGKINVPKKSVVITIDDGLLAERGIEILNKYKLNATVFLITSYYTPSSYNDYEYIEYHSHGHDIHNVGECPGGQGGGIKCLEESVLLDDLSKSSELLNGSTVFCYPFYEYNTYSINVLKKAGYTMAFAGLLNDGKVHVGTNKYLIPRYTIYNNTTVNQLANIIK